MFLRRLRTLMDGYVKPPGTALVNLPIEQKALEWRNLIAPETLLDRAWWGWPGKGGQCNFDPGINLTNGVDQIINQFMVNRRAHLYRKHSVTNIALPIGINKSSNAGIPLAQPANATIAISAFDYNPASGNQDEEFVQLSNTNEYAMDISNWELHGGIQFKFKGGTVIPANSSLYVSPNVKAFRNRAISPRGGQALFAVGPYSGRLSARGETLALANATGEVVSSNSFAGSPSPAQQYLRITEVMYNPSPAPAISDDAQQFEFVELKNISTSAALNLTGIRFAAGIDFNFTGSAVTSLAPGQTVLIVRDQTAFTARYGSGFNIAGQYSGALNNGGETLRLEDAAGEKILEFTYNNTWYPITDGLGFSLVIVDENAPWDSWDNSSAWRASGNLNGSPGQADPNPAATAPVLVNEILTHTDAPQLDSVELLNPTSSAANIGGWYLTDDFLAPKKYRIPNDTTIPAGGYFVIDETQFNVGPNAFRFSELGESVYLFSADANSNLTGYVQGYDFPAEPNGVSFGRYTNSAGVVDLVLQSAVTLGVANAYPRVGPIVISEIMYHPADTNGADDSLAEFVELQNITATNVPLYDVKATTNTWRLRDAVDFNFPIGQTLAAGARLLVVGFDPADATQLAAFKNRYNVPGNVPVYGPWIGKLDNSGETLVLDLPGPVDDTFIVPFYRIDKVSYGDVAPWPAGADGMGNSLQRISNSGYGNEPTNWFAAGVTAGRANVLNAAPGVSILSPLDGAVVNSTNGFTVSVSASDNDGAVALVQLFGDGVELARWSATSSNYVWSSASSGVHQLQARVTDNLGGITESPLISVALLLPPPAVNFLNPANNAILSAGSSVLLSATASSGGGSAARVNYFLDGALIGSASFPFSLPWTPGEPGYHRLSAIAYDAQDQASGEAERSIFIQAMVKNPVVISAGSEWRYLDNGVDQGTTWMLPGFNDNSWSSGLAKFGFNSENSGFGTVLNYGPDSRHKYRTYYFRRRFVVPTLAGMTNLFLEVQRDDGVAIYLNGVNIYRNNLPSGTLTYNQLATNSSDDGNAWQTALLSLGNLTAGTNVIAAEVHQSSDWSSDLGFDLRLTVLGTISGPAIVSQPQDQEKLAGQTASFSAVVTGNNPLSFQWQHAGTNLPGATASTLNIPGANSADAGEYQLIVSNAVGAITSTVANLTIILPDSDGDGLPDAWELANGTNPNFNDALADADHDGLNNLQEFIAGTSPTNAASVLKFETLNRLGTNLILSFPAISNRGYTVQTGADPGVSTWQNWQEIPAAPSNRTVWLTNGFIIETNRFYRLLTPPSQ
jgi:hypothetical protein